ncbi:MAG: FKBP-type peptidyl-prolyl cis-trans isomerase [Deltaproteobacteria bacterium]|nr:FKBP-type peptidyl-prolyl cis-trans isomerase [Deltaproteobacteria bacterium]
MKSIHFLPVILTMTAAACTRAPENAKPAANAAPKAEPAAKPEAADKMKETPPAPTPPDAIPAPPDVAAPPADAAKTKSGLASKVLQPGTGKEHPEASDKVTVHYTGWTTDGKMFDASVSHGGPATFPLDRVIPGWTEGVQLMVTGEKRRFWIPEELAYKGRPGAPQGMLVFDVELISIEKGPKPIPAPPDVAAPPKDAQKTTSGLASKVLKKGKGKVKPKATNLVEVHYTGWTTDGKMFDSSVVRGSPAQFPLDRVIPGWTEGVQLMVEGEQRRLWIPEELAYKGRPGAPQGMLVFDVELIKILQ